MGGQAADRDEKQAAMQAGQEAVADSQGSGQRKGFAGLRRGAAGEVGRCGVQRQVSVFDQGRDDGPGLGRMVGRHYYGGVMIGLHGP